jgi:hypothetical protein
MAVAHRRGEPFYIKISRESTRAEAFSSDVNRIRTAAYRGNKTVKISRRSKQLGQGHPSFHISP